MQQVLPLKTHCTITVLPLSTHSTRLPKMSHHQAHFAKKIPPYTKHTSHKITRKVPPCNKHTLNKITQKSHHKPHCVQDYAKIPLPGTNFGQILMQKDPLTVIINQTSLSWSPHSKSFPLSYWSFCKIIQNLKGFVSLLCVPTCSVRLLPYHQRSAHN